MVVMSCPVCVLGTELDLDEKSRGKSVKESTYKTEKVLARYISGTFLFRMYLAHRNLTLRPKSFSQ